MAYSPRIAHSHGPSFHSHAPLSHSHSSTHLSSRLVLTSKSIPQRGMSQRASVDEKLNKLSSHLNSRETGRASFPRNTSCPTLSKHVDEPDSARSSRFKPLDYSQYSEHKLIKRVQIELQNLECDTTGIDKWGQSALYIFGQLKQGTLGVTPLKVALATEIYLIKKQSKFETPLISNDEIPFIKNELFFSVNNNAPVGC